MRLVIKQDLDTSFVDNTYSIASHMLALSATHLFIASNKWEEIVIEITSDIPDGVLRNISTVCDSIKVVIPTHVDDKILRLLIDLFPSKAGLLRRTYLQGGNVKGVVADAVWTNTQEV